MFSAHPRGHCHHAIVSRQFVEDAQAQTDAEWDCHLGRIGSKVYRFL